ncbi:tetraprenyl-beta-curcumene synthase family protein [Paenibacillus xerothermodurans]|uniref:Tetraprenyl-beta-curcumene synthase family protein n=1 Tax=Paenibacillus xerothermodurans TaxID=1977292 RepID=A0A2W1N9S1_PAEXE|nr:tetraprenyl-beta-curcumene synthase family protein [Paenibacillus xerothermodurans]PZE21167.1 tetraprenyl-beta-curcumene synthase family protein [Paenibacillus xerothermodurans]
MLRVYRFILPEVREQLRYWRHRAQQMPDPELRKQAITSMTSKEFHCQGGAVYAAARLQMRHVLIPLIVALQTISDYLDNLCDRSTSLDPDDFRRLHQSMLDAVDPSAPLHDYYAYRMEKEDGGYLSDLVKTCQASIRLLPSYPLVASEVRELASLYCELQVHKHIRHELREQALLDWWQRYESRYPGISWNEFAAATGSTLGMFMLFLAASDTCLQQQTAAAIRDAYFPYICGLHILLDYLIDQEEDMRGGDLNFCSYYDGMDQTVARIAFIVLKAREKADLLENPAFHRMIVEGLLALYLSDPKVSKQRQVKQISQLLMKGSPLTRLFFLFNSIVIRKTS